MQNDSTCNILVTQGDLDPACPTTQLHLADGRIIQLRTSDLAARPEASQEALNIPDDVQVIPIVAESLDVTKRTVPTGTVRLRKTVQEYEEPLNELLAIRQYNVEHVLLNQPVNAVPDVRHEGDVTIYPVIEERLILTKQLILREEVRVTRQDTERLDDRTVTLKREFITVERESAKWSQAVPDSKLDID